MNMTAHDIQKQNARLWELVESIDALVSEEMGEWYAVDYSQCPAALSNVAHIRDAINDLQVAESANG